MNDSHDLVGAWIAHHEAASPDTAWADDKLTELARRQPLAAWSCILDIYGEAENPRVVGDLSAGPLEELLVFHGGAIIHRLEQEAKRDPRFLILLDGIWQNAIDDDTWARVLKLRQSR